MECLSREVSSTAKRGERSRALGQRVLLPTGGSLRTLLSVEPQNRITSAGEVIKISFLKFPHCPLESLIDGSKIAIFAMT